jgi:methyl-accepting chemotaxis protein
MLVNNAAPLAGQMVADITTIIDLEMEQAAVGTSEVSSNITGVTQAAGETGIAAGEIQGAARDLSEQSVSLKEEVDIFLEKIRTGT